MLHLLTTQSIRPHEDCSLVQPHLAESGRVGQEDGFNEEAEVSVVGNIRHRSRFKQVISPHKDDDRLNMVSTKYLPR